MSEVVISGTGLYTPKNTITNQELVSSFNKYVDEFNIQNIDAINAGEIPALTKSDADFIEKASGIKQRFVMEKEHILDHNWMQPYFPPKNNEEYSIQCEMAMAAAIQALAKANKTSDDIDVILVACSNMCRSYPGVAIELQKAIGAKGYAYDLNSACSSAAFGIQAARNAILANEAKCVLVVNPEICSSHLNFRDRDSHFIFGDACSAILLERANVATSKNQYKIIGTKLKTSFSNNIRNNFGFLNRCTPETENSSDKLFKQNGRKVFKEVVPMVINTIKEHLDELKLQPSDVKRYWLHQANLNMNHLIAKKLLGFEPPNEVMPIILDKYANTSSAGSIIAFHLYNNNLISGDYGNICAFGAGYSVGSIILQKR